MKINEIEEMMTIKGFSEDLFSEYVFSLKRVKSGSLKCQHCYSTASRLKSADFEKAIQLIQFGIDNYAETWFDLWSSLYKMAILYDKNGLHNKAKQIYLDMLDTLEGSRRSSYESHIYYELLRVEMHLTHFTYSKDIETYYQFAIKIDKFAQGFRSFIFYRSIAEMILFKHTRDFAKYNEAQGNAFEALDGEKLTTMDRLLKRHRYVNEAHATEEALRFLYSKNRRISTIVIEKC